MTNQKIAVVTDSTAYIPEDALGDLSIPVIPLWLLWDGDRFRDGIDIDPPAFYHRLKNSSTIPTTSQPSVGEFVEFFKEHARTADTIVGVFISSKISGTVQSALGAQQQLPNPNIHIVDSLSTSMGLGFSALAAARAAAAGSTVDEVIAAAQSVRARLHVLLVVDTLEYLHRGGRIGGAKRLLGTALNIKPVLDLKSGSIEALTQVRTKKKSITQTLDIIEERLAGKAVAEAAVVNVDSPEEGDAVAIQIRERFGVDVVFRSPVSPVIGTHVGPGTIGFMLYSKD